MKKYVLLAATALLLIVSVSLVTAQHSLRKKETVRTAGIPWVYEGNTGNNASIAVPTSLNITIGGRAIQTGDAIGVFFVRNDTLVCAGYGIWQTGKNLGIIAWGDDDQTPAKDGLAGNEVLRIKIWDSVLQKELSCAVVFKDNTPTYANNGIYIVDSLAIVPELKISSPASLPNATVTVPYSFTFMSAGGAAPFKWSVDTSLFRKGFSCSSSGELTGTPSLHGIVSFTVKIIDGNYSSVSKTMLLQVDPAPLVINTSMALPTGVVGTSYSAVIIASGGVTPYRFSIGSGTLPEGLGLDSSTGKIAGIPIKSGQQTFFISLRDANGSVLIKELSLLVTDKIIITTQSALGYAMVGKPSAYSFAATGGTGSFSWKISAGSIPAGLALLPAGTLTGTPSLAGSYSFTLMATDSASHTVEKVFALIVKETLQLTTSESLQPGTIGTAFSQQISATGGTMPYIWSVAGGSLPPGLSLTPAGKISGTPTNAGLFVFTLQIKDSLQLTADKAFTQIVNNPLPVILALSDTVKKTGSGGFTLTVTGTGFQPTSKIRINQAERVTTFISSTQLSTLIASDEIAADGILQVTVMTPPQGGGVSNVRSILVSSTVTGVGNTEANAIPSAYFLAQNYPNPFNPTTTISFGLPCRALLAIRIYDAFGREVSVIVNEDLPAGIYARQWNAAGFPSGTYFCRLQSGTYTETKRLTLLK